VEFPLQHQQERTRHGDDGRRDRLADADEQSDRVGDEEADRGGEVLPFVGDDAAVHQPAREHRHEDDAHRGRDREKGAVGPRARRPVVDGEGGAEDAHQREGADARVLLGPLPLEAEKQPQRQ